VNGQSITQRPNIIQIIAVVGAVLIAITLSFAIMWCAIWKIYIDPSMQMLMGTILGGIAGALTTILVGRTIPQLNQPDEPIQTEINQPPAQPAVVKQPLANPST
jgi:hypothetical protein